MKGVVKGLVIGIIIIIIGVAALLIGLALNGWSFGDNYETREFVSDNPQIECLKIELNAGTLETKYHDEDFILIEYPYSEKHSATVTEDGNTLAVVSPKFNFWNFPFWNIKVSHTVITLPRSMKLEVILEINAGSANFEEGEFTSMDVKVNAGTVNIENVTCGSLKCKVNAGTLNADRVECGDVYCNVNAGSLNVNLKGDKDEYAVSVEKNAGSCNLSSQAGNGGNKFLEIKVNAGSADISFSD